MDSRFRGNDRAQELTPIGIRSIMDFRRSLSRTTMRGGNDNGEPAVNKNNPAIVMAKITTLPTGGRANCYTFLCELFDLCGYFSNAIKSS
jgi:hypothetical protein